MAYWRSYQVTLRVYEPLTKHSYRATAPSDNRAFINAELATDVQSRLISFPPNPVSQRFRSTPLFLPAGSCGDDIARVSPVQEDVRCWFALDDLADHTTKTTMDLIAPKSVRRRAAAAHSAWLQENGDDDRVYARSSAWEVPPAWWLLFDLDLNQVVEIDEEWGTRVMLRASTYEAASRIAWAADVLTEHSKVEEMADSARRISDWIESFDAEGIIELDLGGMSEVIWPDTGSDYVLSWVVALDADDRESAVAAFNAYARHWERINLYSRGS